MRTRFAHLIVSVGLAFGSACAGDDGATSNPEPGTGGKADGETTEPEYYLLQKGEESLYELRRANGGMLACEDGAMAEVCGFSGIDFSEHSGIDARSVSFAKDGAAWGKVLVRGTWRQDTDAQGRSWSYFGLTEAWRAMVNVEARGRYVLVTAAPCEDGTPGGGACGFHVDTLGADEREHADELDLSATDLDPGDLLVVEHRAATSSVVLVGELREEEDGTRTVVATQTHVRLGHDVGEGCELRCYGFECATVGTPRDPSECAPDTDVDMCELWSRCAADTRGRCAWRDTEETDLCELVAE